MYYDVLRRTTTYYDVRRRITTYSDVQRRITTHYDVLRCITTYYTTYYDVLRVCVGCVLNVVASVSNTFDVCRAIAELGKSMCTLESWLTLGASFK